MRTFQIPENQVLENAVGKPTYSYRDFLDEYVWPHPALRADEASAITAEILEDKLDRPKPGDTIELTDAEFEFFAPLATLRDRTLNKDFVRVLNRMIRPVLRAKYAKP